MALERGLLQKKLPMFILYAYELILRFLINGFEGFFYPIPKEFQNLGFDKASAPDLQEAQPTRKQAMCKHMVDGRGCKGGDASALS
ncbi:MAG TPA: hypothetical protein VFU89_02105 [Rhabdochlamydiaceae bacterium]|nr:hypothetical protein [Rhabdochlamydiaceae bacterium]